MRPIGSHRKLLSMMQPKGRIFSFHRNVHRKVQQQNVYRFIFTALSLALRHLMRRSAQIVTPIPAHLLPFYISGSDTFMHDRSP